MELGRKNFHITLIRGPFIGPVGSLNNEPTPPIGLAYIAGSLKKAGFSVSGIDASGEALDRVTPIPNSKLQYHGLGVEEIIERVHPQTKVIGISAMFSHEWPYYKKLIARLKEACPQALIISGGEHCTAMPEYILRDSLSLDYCALGEGEETMVDFCETMLQKGDPKEVKGICYLHNDDFTKTAGRARIKNVDQIPWPEWDIFPIRNYLDQAIGSGPSFGRSMPMMATRGCPYQCTFCSNPVMWDNKYYMRSVDDVIREIKFYKQKYKVTGLQFYDLTAIVQKQWTKEFCSKMIEEKIDLEWSLPSGTRSEALDEENLNLLAKARCKYLVYAPESGSPETLKRIKKKITLEKMTLSMRTAIKAGITVRANLILGFPHERRKNVFQTLMYQMRLVVMGVEEAPLYHFQPYPGTELFQYLLGKKRLQLNDAYFNNLATLSNGKLSFPDDSFCEHVGRVELHVYRIFFGFVLVYLLSYLLRPQRIFRTIKNILFTNKSNTVFEQRIKDKVRKLKIA